MLLNLVSNALKFTDEGSVNLSAELVSSIENICTVAIKVRDTGIGISAEKLNSIFEDFIQAESSTSRKYGGTGLGLAIVKRLAELQNGSVDVLSEPGKGSCFTITIPYQALPDDQLPLKSEKFKPDTAPLKGLRVLIADDTEFNRMVIAGTLKKWKVNYEEAKDGYEAVEKAIQENYDIILMDMRMPGMDGLTATLHIREALGSDNMPSVIAITAGISPTEQESCLNAGITEFLIKPFAEEKFYEILAHRKKNGKGKAASTKKMQPADIKPSKDPNGIINFDQLNRLADNNEDFVREMLEIFMKTAKEGIDSIKKNIANKQWSLAADFAHKISSPCRLLEIATMLECLQLIENAGRSQKNTDKMSYWTSVLESEFKLVSEQIGEFLKVKA